MKKVFIKYNPYKLETELTVDGKLLAQNSRLGEKLADNSRLQEWIEDLPDILIDEYNDTDFEVEFHGTLLDYEDLSYVFTQAYNSGKLTAKINRQPAKETSDKEVLIDAVFNKIQKGPFDELKSSEITSAFEHAKSSDFEVCVVATMSAGKSTLINAMLSTKLMPSKQEACTAIITRIKDCTQAAEAFKAEVYDQKDRLSETHEKLSYPIMERLNGDENVSVINVSGNIPFLTSDDVSLVLIDTPGPNNSRDPRHKKVQSDLLGKSSKALVLYIMTGEFGTDDDNTLLGRVADSMSVGGKQSKDRFIFVINKLDDRKKEDGDTQQTLERVRSYLKTHGVTNPNLFPAAALPALNLRLMASDADVDEDTIDETEMKIKKLNRNEALHFETYAALAPSMRGEINGMLASADSAWDGRENENPQEALIHTGIISIEAAIRQYVQKYAKTAKVKNIVDTFTHKLDEVGCFEETKRELAKNRDESQRIVDTIEAIREKMDNARDAKKFKNIVDDAVVKVGEDSKEVVEGIIRKFQAKITKRIDNLRDKELSVDDAEDAVERLIKFAQELEPDFEVELDGLIRNSIIETSDNLLNCYRDKLASLTSDLNATNSVRITIDPIKLIGGSVNLSNFTVKQFVVEEKRVVGSEAYTVKEQTRDWFESFAFWPKSEYVTKYRDVSAKVKFVPGSELAQTFFKPVQQQIYNNAGAANRYALKQAKGIADHFNEEFKQLDGLLKTKLTELKSYATDKEKAEERIKESERKLAWLEVIKTEVESILEI